VAKGVPESDIPVGAVEMTVGTAGCVRFEVTSVVSDDGEDVLFSLTLSDTCGVRTTFCHCGTIGGFGMLSKNRNTHTKVV